MGKSSVLGKLQVFQWLEHGTDLEREAGPLEKGGRGEAAWAVEEDEGLGLRSWLGAQPDTSGQGGLMDWSLGPQESTPRRE